MAELTAYDIYHAHGKLIEAASIMRKGTHNLTILEQFEIARDFEAAAIPLQMVLCELRTTVSGPHPKDKT